MLGKGIGSVTVGATANDPSPWLTLSPLRLDPEPRNIALVSTDTAFSGTISAQVSADGTTSSSKAVTLQDSGSDVNVVAGKATLVRDVPFNRIRFTSSTDEAADRLVRVWVQ